MKDRATDRRCRIAAASAVMVLVFSVLATALPGTPAGRPLVRGSRPYARPIAFIGGHESGGAENPGGFSSWDYDNRALPHATIKFEQTNGALQAFRAIQTRATQHPGLLVAGSTWRDLGPTDPAVPAPSTYTGRDTTVSGRITALAIAPTCAPGDCRLWVGAAGGGVWRTDDALRATPVWVAVDNGLDTNAIGSLVVDPTDASGNTIYAGTGEPNGSGDSEAGQGLYRSRDGGDTWHQLGASIAVAKDRGIAAIAIDPRDGDHLYIGTTVARHGSASVNGGRRTPPGAPTLGLYESTDGGGSWSLLFSQPASPTDPATGSDYFQGGITGIELDPSDPNTIYAGVFGSGLWRRSQALEGDADFHQVFATMNPADFFGDRLAFDLVDMGGATRIYLGDSSDDLGTSLLWRVDDASVPAAGLTDGSSNPGWTQLSDTAVGSPGFGSYNFCQGQCTYDLFVSSPPGRPDEVWLGGAMNYDEIFGPEPPRSNGRAVIRSTDAGASWDDMTNDARTPPLGMHPDQHAIVFSPDDPGTVFVGSDGGLVRLRGQYQDDSAECDARGLTGADLSSCRDWLSAVPTKVEPINDGLATIQFQSVSVNPTDAADLMGGTQDNGTWSNSPDWFETINGDGGQSGFDAGDPTVRFHTYYEASPDVNFRGNDPYGWNWIGDPLFETEPQSFYIPIIADPVNPGYLYAGLSHVWRTTDDGGDQAFLEQHCNEYTGDFKRHCGDWKSIGGHTGDLTSSVWGDRAGQYVVAVERAPSDSGTLWAATRIGRVFVSANADAHRVGAVDFARIDTTTTPGRFVSGISIDPADANHAWISYSGYEAYTPGQAGHVFSVRFDPASGTATWRDLSAGLGDQPVLDVAWDSVGRRLYAATDFGVLMRSRGTWVPAGTGLPTAAVYGLTIVPDSGVLYAATHGRGIWRLGL